MTTIDVLPTFDQLVDRWKAWSRTDALERYDIFAQVAVFLRYNPDDVARMCKAFEMSRDAFNTWLRVTRKISRREAETIVGRGIGWSYLIQIANSADAPTKIREACGEKPARIVKAELLARPAASRSGRSSARDQFLVAISEASPQQVCNWLDSYIRDSCPPSRANALRDGLSWMLNGLPKMEDV